MATPNTKSETVNRLTIPKTTSLDVNFGRPSYVSVQVGKLRQEEIAATAAEEQKKRDEAFKKSLQDGSYFNNNATATEETESMPPSVDLPPASDNKVTEQTAGTTDNNEGTEHADEQHTEETTTQDTQNKNAIARAMEWITADYTRAMVVTTVFCTLCWMVVKLAKR